ncbi:helix-turn-helix domain-containing protein [Candidatus Margulisiibacteriota bacterium]
MKKDIYTLIGQKLRNKREDKKYSQLKVCLHCDISLSTVRNIEHHKQRVQIHIIEKVANYLGLSLAQLFKEIKR